MPPPPTTTTTFFLLLLLLTTSTHSTTFTFSNNCPFTVWPALLSNSGSPPLPTTGFELPSSTSLPLQLPSSWSGRLWARTGCSLNPTTNLFLCSTADCASGDVPCNGAGATPPATLAEFTLSSSGRDFYDVSLVDGYNLPILVSPSTPGCLATGCLAELNNACPVELRAADGQACRSACEAFGTDEYCCSGEHANPNTCRPSVYSEAFKAACPRAYSYAYDDATSTFTCEGGGDYLVTFCPASAPSQKSSRETWQSPAQMMTTEGADVAAVAQNEAWLASLATGAASTVREQIYGSAAHLLMVVVVVITSLLL